MLPLSEKVIKVLDLIRKEREVNAEAADIYSENKYSTCEIVKEKEIRAGLLLPLKNVSTGPWAV